MRRIETIHAVGHVLCHDLTRIVPGTYKGAQFRKGHVVTAEDIPMLLSMGKEHLFVWEMDENHSARKRRRVAPWRAVPERVDAAVGRHPRGASWSSLPRGTDSSPSITERLAAINALTDIMIATRHTNEAVREGDILCGTRVIPLVIDRRQIEAARRPSARGNRCLRLCRSGPLKAGIVTTGSEVFKGLIEDRFTPVVRTKLAAYGVETVRPHHDRRTRRKTY